MYAQNENVFKWIKVLKRRASYAKLNLFQLTRQKKIFILPITITGLVYLCHFLRDSVSKLNRDKVGHSSSDIECSNVDVPLFFCNVSP